MVGALVALGVFAFAAQQASAQKADNAPAAFVSARTDTNGENIIVTFSEAVTINPAVTLISDQHNIPLLDLIRGVLSVTIDGREDLLSGAAVSGSELTIRVTAPPIEVGQAVTVASDTMFTDRLGPLFVDVDGDSVAPFPASSVQNLSTVPASSRVAAGTLVNPSSLRISEGDEARYTVRLPAPPSSDVTVELLVWRLGAFRVQPNQMTFTTTNWNVPQLATVVTNSDDDAQDIWTVILHTRSDAGLGRAAAIVRVIVDDEDELLRVSGNSAPQYTESATTTVATYAAPWAPGVTWSLSGTDSEHFSISRGGDLSFVAPPDYEHPADDNADNVYHVGVRASDGTAAGFLAVTVPVTDVNEPPDVFGPVGVRIAEGAGRFVGTYTYDDPEAGAVRWSLAGSDGHLFTITNGELRFREAPDFERPADANGNNRYELTVLAEDGGDLPGRRRVTVSVIDGSTTTANHAPTFRTSSTDRFVDRHAAARTQIGPPVAAIDEDGDQLTYGLSERTARSFDIDEHTGQLRLKPGTVLDPAEQRVYRATVTATDPSGATASIDVTITVTTASRSRGPSRAASSVDFEWTVDRDLDDLDAHNEWTTGLWSDGTTLWITEAGPDSDAGVYAYDLASGERRERLEFDLDVQNRAPRGISSDRATAWLSNADRDRLYAYGLASGERAEHHDILLDARNGDAHGLWSDDAALWVVDGEDAALFAYDLSSGDLLAEYRLNFANDAPRGVWSDGVTVWVADDDAKRLFAYELPTQHKRGTTRLERVEEEDFGELSLSQASNNSPRGIWSDGGVMYVADVSDGRVYSYNMPDAIDARLGSLTLSSIDIGEFSPATLEYQAVAPAGVTVTTVDPHAEQAGTRVDIKPPDIDTRRSGHQVAVAGGVEVTVTVTSTDGSRERVYRVAIEPAPVASCLRGAVDVGVSLLIYEGGSVDELTTCAEGRHVKALYATQGGDFVSYILGAPDFVNRAFREIYPDGVPANTPLLATSDGPASR
ncbi:MAG: cadherin-like beta sandwich domain-containing protein [Chloroflexi bacterium]|nr:cadherin-like beta sandwich domain-containing protein [Chloroflexota bacterium]